MFEHWSRFDRLHSLVQHAGGPTDTPILAVVEATHLGRYDGRRSRVPLGRAAPAEEQARSILFLASSDASHFTGTIIMNDGGQTALSSG
jgi:NAD(P)-dependent dehydrogenase (short-subunit alcohol dehydrogenase family)